MRRLLLPPAVALLLPLAACIPQGRVERDAPAAADLPPPPEQPAFAGDWRPPADDRATTPPQVAAPPPAWRARPVTAAAADVQAQSYTVQPGDTLRRVADRTGAGSEAIARENDLVAPFVIKAGQTLRIPAGRYHRVLAGQTGIAIARAYGVEWSRVIALNHLEDPYTLRVDQRLLIPSREEVRDMSMEQRARAFMLDIDDLVTGSEPALAQNAKPAAPTQTASRPVPSTKPVAEPANFGGRFIWPLQGAVLTRFGPYGSGRINEGINIAAKRGAPIVAAADGVVAYVGSEIAVYGGLILIKHGDGWITTYGYADELLVTRGQAVKRGQVIARAGATGNAQTPQLHFEIRQGRKPVNPLGYLPATG